MFFSLSSFFCFLVVVALLTLLSQRRQFLMVLLVMESLVLLFLSVVLFSSFSDLYIGFIILAMAACEASLGLALLVGVVRCFGNDNLKSLTTLKW